MVQAWKEKQADAAALNEKLKAAQSCDWENGYEFDAVVAEDHIAKDVREYTPIQRTERMMYDESTMTICAKYAAGCACEL